MSCRKRSKLTTLRIVILVLTAGMAASATSPLRGKPGQPVVIKRIELIHGAAGVEIEITASGPMRINTSRLSDPERFVVDVQDSLPDPELSTGRVIAVDATEIKSVRIGRVYQPGESITRIILDLGSRREMQVTSAPDGLKLRLRAAEFGDETTARRKKTGQPSGAVPAARGGLSARRQVPSEEEKRQPEMAATTPARAAAPSAEQQPEPAALVAAAESKVKQAKPAPMVAAVDRTPNVGAEKPIHDAPAAAMASSRPAAPETVKVEGLMSQPRRPPAEMAATPKPPAVQPPPLVAQPEAVRIEGVVSQPRRPPAEMAATPKPPAAQPPPVPAQPEPVSIEGLISQPRAAPAEMAVIPAPPLRPVGDNKQREAAANASADTSINVGSKPVASAPALGAGVTGKAKDATLGSDDEAAIKASIPSDNHVPVPRNGEAPLPIALLLSGAATGGYYAESTSHGATSREASPVGSLRLDAAGYIHSPGFLNFTIKPQGSVGRSSSDGVFPDGEGVFASATLLGNGATPLTLSYHRLNRKLVTFGPLDRLAGLEANTFQDSLGANWKIRFKKLPELGLNYSNYSDSYDPLAALAPKTANSGRLLSADLTETALGWNLQTRYKLERSSQELINIFDPTQAPYLYKRNNQEIRASADRDFGRWLSTSFVAGTTKSRNEVQSRPFDQSFRFVTGNSFFRAGKKLTLGFHAGVTDNLVGAFLDSATGGTGLPAQPLVFIPSTARLRMVNYSGSAQYAVTRDLRLQGDVLRESTSAPQNSSIAASSSELTSVQTGVAFAHRFRLWQFQSYYAVNGGRLHYASTGSSRSSGQRANFGVTIGSVRLLELTAGVHGSLQNVTGNTYLYDRSAGANVGLSRLLWERWTLRATYNRERDQYRFTSTKFSSISDGISVSVIHPRVELSAARNIRDGLTFQADPRLQFVSSDQSGLLLGAFPGTLAVPSGATWSSASVSFHPVPKFTGRFGWLNSRQRLQGAVSNYYTEWEASVGYQFRSISLDVGYVAHDQNFAVDLFKRHRIFFRAVREFTIF